MEIASPLKNYSQSLLCFYIYFFPCDFSLSLSPLHFIFCFLSSCPRLVSFDENENKKKRRKKNVKKKKRYTHTHIQNGKGEKKTRKKHEHLFNIYLFGLIIHLYI